LTGSLQNISNIIKLFNLSPAMAAAFSEVQQGTAAEDKAKPASSSSKGSAGRSASAAGGSSKGSAGRSGRNAGGSSGSSGSRGAAADSGKPAVSAGASSNCKSNYCINRTQSDKAVKMWACTQCGVQKPVPQMLLLGLQGA
jgi:hypothetical protein